MASSSSAAVHPERSMIPIYLYGEPLASFTLRNLANRLNAAAAFGYPHIGFDLEWKPNFTPGQPENSVAVIQLGYETEAYVVHIKWMTGFPDGLLEILQSPRVVKVGVGIQHDAKKLYRDLGVSLVSCVDLSLFVKCVDAGLFSQRLQRYADVPIPSRPASPTTTAPPKEVPSREYYSSPAFLGPHTHRLFRGPYTASIGLARLAELYEGLVLTKGKITQSNWEAALNPDQVQYAALDAYAGSIVYAHLASLFHLLTPATRPKRKFYAFDCIRGNLYYCRGDERRTLLGQPLEANAYPLVPHIAEEIMFHLQGIGTDQPRGLIPWGLPSNPEYDPGPMPPQKTPEEKERAKREKERMKMEKRKEMRKQNGAEEGVHGQTGRRRDSTSGSVTSHADMRPHSGAKTALDSSSLADYFSKLGISTEQTPEMDAKAAATSVSQPSAPPTIGTKPISSGDTDDCRQEASSAKLQPRPPPSPTSAVQSPPRSKGSNTKPGSQRRRNKNRTSETHIV